MANFCSKCGKPLGENEVCSCSGKETKTNNANFKNVTDKLNVNSAKGFFESLKNRMGIGDPELNKGDAFENNKNIVPDCIKANEGEVPVKQYKVATLRNRILGITYTKAVGRLQVTNKRIIFRAPGRCLAGRTTLQHEFEIDEIAGVEARREYVFSFWDVLIGAFVSIIGGAITTAITTSTRNIAAMIIFALIFGIAGCVPFFILKKKWLLKLLCQGASYLPLLVVGSMPDAGFLLFLSFISFLLTLFALLMYSINPNLVLVIKTKGATDAIDIKRKKSGLFAGKGEQEDHTGFEEIIPEDDAEQSIREVGALINDIQKLGDFGIEKWKA